MGCYRLGQRQPARHPPAADCAPPPPFSPARRCALPLPGGTPRHSSQLPPPSHPPATSFLGIAYDPLSRLWQPQAGVGVDAAQRPIAGAEPSAHSMAPCPGAAEAALLRDVALVHRQVWLAQPLGAGPEFFNFPVGR